MRALNCAAWLIASLLVAAGFVRLWQQIADHRLVSPVFLPGPDRAWAALLRGFAQGTLTANLLGTLKRMMLGWLIASVVGARAWGTGFCCRHGPSAHPISTPA